MLHRTLAILLCSATQTLAGGPDPQAEAGRLLYEEHCVECHMPDGTGESADAVDNRGLSEAKVRRAAKGVDDMPEIELTSEEAKAIVAWLAVLEERGGGE